MTTKKDALPEPFSRFQHEAGRPLYSADQMHAFRAEGVAAALASKQAPALSEGALTDLFAEHLSGTYHCTRVWQAWGVGTMSQNDFQDVGESDTPLELAAAVMALVAQAKPEPAASGRDARDGEKLWLWRNGDHFLAFRNLYPCFSPGGDPMTLGEPVATAFFRESHNRTGKENT